MLTKEQTIAAYEHGIAVADAFVESLAAIPPACWPERASPGYYRVDGTTASQNGALHDIAERAFKGRYAEHLGHVQPPSLWRRFVTWFRALGEEQ